MPDTFFTASPHWTWYIIPYFFIGGIAGGAYFLAAILEWFGRPEDRPVIRTGYSLAFWGAILCGLLLTIDLGKPFRFWHMLFQSENFPHLMFKGWSPISFGAWAILLFGACAGLSLLGAWAEEGRVRAPAAQVLRGGTTLAKLVAAVGGLLGFFVAGYTGVLLSVTNRPIWADSPWLGALFLASGASTGAAALVLLAPGRGAVDSSIRWLSSFDTRVLIVELLILVLFIASLWPIRQVWVSVWGFLLLVGVVGAGIVWPLLLHAKPSGGGALRNPAVMVLLGGFLLRVVILLASNGIEVQRVASGMAR
jgi:formate-dependent nitrite reductase membrane component NrfD